jgi:hypothetical protein
MEPPKIAPDGQDEEKGWKKPFILMIVVGALPVVIVAVAFAVHSF